MTGYMWNGNWIIKFWMNKKEKKLFDLDLYVKVFWKRKRMTYCSTSVQFPIHCTLYISTVQKKSFLQRPTFHGKKEIYLSMLCSRNSGTSWDIRRTRSELWRRTIQKKAAAELLRTSVENGSDFRFCKEALSFWCIFVWRQYQLTQCLLGGNSSRWRKNCHGQKLLLMLHSLTIAFWYEVILQNFPDIEEDSHSTSRPHFFKFCGLSGFIDSLLMHT